MQVTRKELTGRNSAASSVVQHNHKAGAVPKYLKVLMLMKTMVKIRLDENLFLQARQTEWREAEERRIASIPVIVITIINPVIKVNNNLIKITITKIIIVLMKGP